MLTVTDGCFFMRRLSQFQIFVAKLGETQPLKLTAAFQSLETDQDKQFQEAFTTFPDFRQLVQTRRRLVAPFTTARTGRRFTFQRRLLTL
jgi:hypothetical protein